jgi:hypothetical protein
MESIGYEKTLSTNLTVGVDENDGKVRPVTGIPRIPPILRIIGAWCDEERLPPAHRIDLFECG